MARAVDVRQGSEAEDDASQDEEACTSKRGRSLNKHGRVMFRIRCPQEVLSSVALLVLVYLEVHIYLIHV